MKRPIFFLDVDGVLNDFKTFRNLEHHPVIPESLTEKEKIKQLHFRMLNPVLVTRMRDTVRTCGADVVLSSSWRILFSLEDVKEMLAEHGWEDVPFIGMTSVTNRRPRRGEEIRDWMHEHGEGRPFVIIDDDSDMLPGQPFVQTDIKIGFSPEDQRKVLDILT